MGAFEVLLHGQGIFLLDEVGAERMGGVYALVSVRARDAEAARALAEEAIWKDPLFISEVLNKDSRQVFFVAERVTKRPFWKRQRRSAPVFYIEDEKANG